MHCFLSEQSLNEFGNPVKVLQLNGVDLIIDPVQSHRLESTALCLRVYIHSNGRWQMGT